MDRRTHVTTAWHAGRRGKSNHLDFAPRGSRHKELGFVVPHLGLAALQDAPRAAQLSWRRGGSTVQGGNMVKLTTLIQEPLVNVYVRPMAYQHRTYQPTLLVLRHAGSMALMLAEGPLCHFRKRRLNPLTRG